VPSWLFGSLRGYDRAWLRGDVIAGLTVWAVLVPEALAYASIAIVVLRPEGPLFFADADHVRAFVRSRACRPGVRAVVLDLETVPFVDVTAAEMLARLRGDLDDAGVRLYVARDIGQVRDELRTAGDAPRRVYPTIGDAVAAVRQSAR